MIISYINSVFDTSNNLTSSSESTTRPLSNLLEKEKWLPFRTEKINGQYILLFNTDGINADYIAILNHNIADNTTILIEGDNFNNFANPSFSEMVKKSGSNDISYKFSETPLTYKYWRIYFTTGQVGDVEYNSGCYSGTRSITAYQNTSESICYGEAVYSFDAFGRGASDTVTTVYRGDVGFCYGEINYYTPNVSSTFEDFIEIGVLWLGESLSFNYQKQNMNIVYNADTRQNITVNGSVYGSTVTEYRTTDIELPIIKTSEKNKLTSFYKYVRNYNYFISQIWNEDTEVEEPMYSIYDDEQIVYKKEKSIIYPFSTKIAIREVN